MALAMFPVSSSATNGETTGEGLSLAISRGEARFRAVVGPDSLQFRQFYHALVLHKHRQDLFSLLLSLNQQCAGLNGKVMPLSAHGTERLIARNQKNSVLIF